MTSLKSMLPQFLHTPRLVLQLFDYSPSHYSCLLSSMNSPTAHKNMGDFGIATPEAFDKLNFSTRLQPSIFPRPVLVDTDVYYLLRLGSADGPLMGGVSIAQRGARVPPDMGWCLLEAYHRHGYAIEAATELLRIVREVLGIKEVMAWPGISNGPSRKVAERVGFVDGGEMKGADGEVNIVYVLPGMKVDSNVVLSLYGDETETVAKAE